MFTLLQKTAAAVTAIAMAATLFVVPSTVNAATTVQVVTPSDLAVDTESWYFYNDTSNTPSATEVSGDYEFVDGPANPPVGEGSIEFNVEGTERFNIATAQFAGTDLSDLTDLGMSIYNSGSDSTSQGLFLNFDIDFDNTITDGYVGRLVFVPNNGQATPEDDWFLARAIEDGIDEGDFTWSRYDSNGNLWPDGDTDRYRPFSEIVAQFPNAEIFNESFTGQLLVRAGHPTAGGQAGFVDAVAIGINDDVTIFDFEPAPEAPADSSIGAAVYTEGYDYNSDNSDDRPSERVKFRLYTNNYQTLLDERRTNNKGHAKFRDLEAGTYQVCLVRKGYGDYKFDILSPANGKDRVEGHENREVQNNRSNSQSQEANACYWVTVDGSDENYGGHVYVIEETTEAEVS